MAQLSKLGPIAGLFAIATITSSVWAGAGDVRFLRIAGVLIGLVALPLSAIPIPLLVRQGKPREGGNYLQTTRVVGTSVFSVVRHPQYLSYILFMITFGLLAQSVVVTALALVAIGLLYGSMLLEEGECVKKFGPDYLAYMAKVPRANLAAGAWRLIYRANRSSD